MTVSGRHTTRVRVGPEPWPLRTFLGPLLLAWRAVRGLLVVLAKNLAGERVHKVDLLTHDTGHRLIRILVLRNLFGGGESLNTKPRVWAAIDKWPLVPTTPSALTRL